MAITKITKGVFVKTEDNQDLKNGVLGFQMITIEYEFYGVNRTEDFDTKVMADGRQIIIDGSGFFKSGTEI
jgi:hypothetical protein